MAKISTSSIEQVRDASDIVEVIGTRTDLRRQGARWTGLCPFHEERTPSFSVNAADKLYYCFGCEARGDIFSFVQETEGVGFGEAVELLAERYGVEIERDEEDPREAEARRRRDRLAELLARAEAYYSKYLWEAPKAAKARDYLEDRGLSEEVLRRFGVGLSPSEWGALMVRAQEAGYRLEELAAAGLVRKGRDGGYYDAFRARIIFPIRDRRGRVLGFGARATKKDQVPKYVNSAETELYRKSQILYGIDQARAAIAKAGRAVLVEGYTDVLAMHQAGITETVGVMGTAITDQQIALLAGLMEELILCLDADAAGQKAMLRAQEVAGKRRLRLKVATVPGGQDPAEFLAEPGGAENFRALLDAAVGIEEFQVELILARTDRSSPEARDLALAEVAPVLRQLEEGAVREELTRRVSDRLDLDAGLVNRRIAAAAGDAAGGGAGGSPSRPISGPSGGGDPGVDISGDPGPIEEGTEPRYTRARVTLTPRERRERALLSMCIEAPGPGKDILGRLTPDHLSSPLSWRGVEWLREHLEAPLEGLPREDEELTGLIQRLVMQSTPPESGSLAGGYEPASAEAMELNFLILEQRRLELAIAAAGKAGDVDRRKALSLERAGLFNRMTALAAEAPAIGPDR